MQYLVQNDTSSVAARAVVAQDGRVVFAEPFRLQVSFVGLVSFGNGVLVKVDRQSLNKSSHSYPYRGDYWRSSDCGPPPVLSKRHTKSAR